VRSDMPMAWSADGSQVALMLRAVDNKDRWLVTVDPGQAAFRLRHRLTDPAWINWNFNEFGWLPDGRTLWYLSEESGYSHLYLHDGTKPRALTSGQWEASSPALSADGMPNVEGEALRVLVVDDSLASRRHLHRLLTELGIERITEAADGKEAVALLEQAMVDLVITDYNMPEMDGRELTEYIRTQSWQAEVPILMVTSEQNMGRLAAVERAGVSAICDKPFEAGNIRRLISDALTR